MYSYVCLESYLNKYDKLFYKLLKIRKNFPKLFYLETEVIYLWYFIYGILPN